jgi:hypothetical protein
MSACSCAPPIVGDGLFRRPVPGFRQLEPEFLLGLGDCVAPDAARPARMLKRQDRSRNAFPLRCSSLSSIVERIGDASMYLFQLVGRNLCGAGGSFGDVPCQASGAPARGIGARQRHCRRQRGAPAWAAGAVRHGTAELGAATGTCAHRTASRYCNRRNRALIGA